MSPAMRDPSEPLELVRSDLRGLWLLALPAVVLAPVPVLLADRATVAIMFALLAAVFVAAVLAVRFLAGRNAIFADDKGIIVVTRGHARRTVPWSRITRAAWDAGSFWTAWEPGGVVVTLADPRGRVRIGAITIVRKRARAAAAARVEGFLWARLPAVPVAPPGGASKERTTEEDETTSVVVEDRNGSAWWREGVLYQVYLRSFADSDRDGVGDIRGLIARLDHLVWLGVDGIWVSPVMPSPNDDWGYDVADYTAVDPRYGTLDDVEHLVAEASARGMRVLFDLVPNHTSDRHPWFLASRSSRDDPKRDWYVWADPKPDGSEPNNWISNFFGPAWTFDPATGQYYMHSFLQSQPDLNWWNPVVWGAIEGALRFWFDRGIAGFRIDVCHKLVKDRLLRDNPAASEHDSFMEQAWGQRELYSANLPQTHEIIRRWRSVADSYDEPRVLVGETYVLDLATMASYHGTGDELHLAFNIPFLYAPLNAPRMREVIDATMKALPFDAWPVWNGGSHDISRMATRWGGGDERKVRCALMLVLMLPGTPLLYYGDEIGMPDTLVPLERSVDPLGKKVGAGGSAGRDPARTPMPWSHRPGAGFTAEGVEPWLPFGDLAACNVGDQRADPWSVLRLCRDLIALRREDRTAGSRTECLDGPPDVLVWRRGRAVVALNLADEPATIDGVSGRVRVGTRRERDGDVLDGALALAPWEGVVFYE